MTALLQWNQLDKREFMTGVDRPVLYPRISNGTYPVGVAWEGLTAVNEKPTGAEQTDLYANNQKYLTLVSQEKFEGTIEAYIYPPEFEECDGSAAIEPGLYVGQQSRKEFGLSYRTAIGNETDKEDHAYVIHLVYGALATPTEQNHSTIGETPEAATLSWDFKTTPVEVPGFRPSAHLRVDSRDYDAGKLAALELILYGEYNGGVGDVDARLPLPTEVLAIIGA